MVNVPKSEFEFSYTHTNEYGRVDLETSSKSSGESWMDLTREFVHFLRGCGFIIEDKRFADSVQEEFGYEEEADSLDMEDV